MKFAFVIRCISLLLATPLLAAEPRSWTSLDGNTITAEMLSFDGKQVALKLADGRTVNVPIARLIPLDQGFIRAQPATIAPLVWPPKVTVPSTAIEVKLAKEDAGLRKFIYTSEAFSYSSQGKLLPSLMKEVARTFEATRQLVNALPWGIVCKPPEGLELYEAALFETRDDYLQAGGPRNSGGVYMTAEKIFKIPDAARTSTSADESTLPFLNTPLAWLTECARTVPDADATGISPNSISIAQTQSAGHFSHDGNGNFSRPLSPNLQTNGAMDACDLFIGKAQLL